MNELTIKENITSLELLEQINFFRREFEDRKELLHKNLLAIIKDEFEEEIGELKIQPTSYKDVQGKERPMYILTLQQAKQVLVRESKKVRKAVIHYIEELEEKLKNKFSLPTTYKEALQELLTTVEENEKLQLTVSVQNQQIQELQPKASYYDLVLQSDCLMSVTKIAKDFGLSGVALNKILHEERIQYKQGTIWLLYQKYSNLGYTQTQTQLINGKDKSTVHTYWTQKGRLFIYDLLKNKRGILPVIEKEQMEAV